MKILEKIKMQFSNGDSTQNNNEYQYYLNKLKDEECIEYIKARIIPQIDYYESKSKSNKRWYNILSIISIVVSASISTVILICNFNSEKYVKVVASLLSAVVTVITAILMHLKSKDLWIRYRYTCESLKGNLYLFFTVQGKYKGLSKEEAFEKLVEFTEEELLCEVSKWDMMYKEKSK